MQIAAQHVFGDVHFLQALCESLAVGLKQSLIVRSKTLQYDVWTVKSEVKLTESKDLLVSTEAYEGSGSF
jgi:hypothetical protein